MAADKAAAGKKPMDEQDDHLLSVLRYAERNALRASLVKLAEAWPWSSLAWRRGGRRPEMLCDWPVSCPRQWLQHVNAPQSEAELAALRRSTERGTPYGNERWQKRVATHLGLESSLRPRGRPRNAEK
jgi:putative transposase